MIFFAEENLDNNVSMNLVVVIFMEIQALHVQIGLKMDTLLAKDVNSKINSVTKTIPATTKKPTK